MFDNLPNSNPALPVTGDVARLVALAYDGINNGEPEAARDAVAQIAVTAEKALVVARRSEAVLSASSDAIITLDRDFRVIYANAEAARINKKPVEAFLGKLHWEEWPASVGTQFETQFRRAMIERIPVRFLEHYHVPNEYDDWIRVSAYPAAEEDGGGIHVVYRDVTERYQQEQRTRFLAELAERARAMTDPEAVIADAVQSLGAFLQVSRCTFADIDPEADTVTIHLDYCADGIASIAGVMPLSAFGSFVADELSAGHAVVVDDVHTDSLRVPPDKIPTYEAATIGAFLAVPVVYSSRLVSLISLHSATPRHWKLEKLDLLRTVVERTWLTVQITREHQETQRLAKERARLVAHLQEAGARQRRFLREMLAGFTEGRLRLCFAPAELPAPLTALSAPITLSPKSLRLLRQQAETIGRELGMPEERIADVLTAAHEAAMNAVRHSGDTGSTARICGDRETGVMQIWVEDHGPGIAEDMIHRAVEQGFTTGGFGQGFFLMRSCADRVYLLTGKTGTTIVIEQERNAPLPTWLK